MALYRYFLDGVPEYLARNYWWAYLWRFGTWFFDHQPIINAILFGQYQRLMDETLRLVTAGPTGRTLQLTCVYGKLTPELLRRNGTGPLHILDAAMVQLNLSKRKTAGHKLIPVRGNAEALGYRSASFDTVIIFFLLHEMPPEARRNTLSEAMRVLSPGGRLILTEYGASPKGNILYRFPVTRWIMGTLEPFLPGFWEEDLDRKVIEAGAANGKEVRRNGGGATVFDGFYRVVEYGVGG